MMLSAAGSSSREPRSRGAPLGAPCAPCSRSNARSSSVRSRAGCARSLMSALPMMSPPLEGSIGDATDGLLVLTAHLRSAGPRRLGQLYVWPSTYRDGAHRDLAVASDRVLIKHHHRRRLAP